MENSQPLAATESFSYSWLIDRKPSSDDEFLNHLTPRFPDNSSEKEQNFNFDVPVTAYPVALVHADEIFCDGHIMPLYVDRSKVETLKTSASSFSPSPVSSKSSPFFGSKNQSNYLTGRWRKSYKRILQKCFGFVKPLCQTIGFSRKNNRVDDLERKVCEVQSWNNSLETSPRPSSAYSVVDWDDVKKIDSKFDVYYGLKRVKSWSSSSQVLPRMSPSYSSNAISMCDVENSINEAILYCKRSIEK